jgi:hypothetical protein
VNDAEQPTIAQLIKEIHAAFDEALSQRDEARRERDETRREFCEVCAPEWGLPSPKWLAEDKGWDCYKETL